MQQPDTILHYILFHKPYGVLSQFTEEAGHLSLKKFGPFPPDVYPVGRLDVDSEGLLLLTNDAALKHRIATPRFRHPRTYVVQVEGIPDATSLKRLAAGVVIEGRKTLPARARLLDKDPGFPPRAVPIRVRKSVPTSWLELVLHEGRNRQVRKMTAAVGHPTLRLVRTQIGQLELGSLEPGRQRTLSPRELSEVRGLLKKR